ncbi:hypothetical protein ACWEGE_15695 [Amycolatopsis sp. NPDC004747]
MERTVGAAVPCKHPKHLACIDIKAICKQNTTETIYLGITFLNSIYKYIAPAHRALWRWPILAFAVLGFDLAIAPAGQKLTSLSYHSAFITVYVFGLIFGIFETVSEYRHPRADVYKTAGSSARKWNLVSSGILATIIWLYIKQGQIMTEWPWLFVIWIPALAIYLLRPREPQN